MATQIENLIILSLRGEGLVKIMSYLKPNQIIVMNGSEGTQSQQSADGHMVLFSPSGVSQCVGQDNRELVVRLYQRSWKE